MYKVQSTLGQLLTVNCLLCAMDRNYFSAKMLIMFQVDVERSDDDDGVKIPVTQNILNFSLISLCTFLTSLHSLNCCIHNLLYYRTFK